MNELLAWHFTLVNMRHTLEYRGRVFMDNPANSLEDRWSVFLALNLGTVFTYVPLPGQPPRRDLTVDATDAEKEWAIHNRCFGWNTL